MTFPLTAFIIDLFVLDLPLSTIREKARRDEYRPVSKDVMKAYVDMSGRN